MLTRLVIHDVVLIDRLALEPAAGLTALTGETGAGKSILLDALGLATGGRSDAALVRMNTAQASVTAEFDLPPRHPACTLVREQGLDIEGPLLLRRQVGQDGKSRAFINDQPVSITLLRQIGGLLVEVHGQHDTHGLLDPSTHRILLDAFGGFAPVLADLDRAFADWRMAAAALEKASGDIQRAEAEETFLRAALAELDQLGPETGEAEKLSERRTNLQHREKILDALQQTKKGVSGDRGADRAVIEAARVMARVVDKTGPLGNDLLAALDRAANELAEAANLIERLLSDGDRNEGALDDVEERLFALRACARKHNVGVDDLPRLRQELATRLDQLEHQGDHLAALSKKVAATKFTYENLARDLSAKRRAEADKLCDLVARELQPLKLERARIFIDMASLPESQWSGLGMDRVTFLAATNPGSAPGPMHKIASGGELSRFMLALKVVLAAADPVPTLIFDEVDAGIGGATASAVGERLARLAEKVQVLVVTHSPQVAAKASHHWRVAKEVADGKTTTHVVALAPAARREEIARMLAGSEVTDAARAAAESLLTDHDDMTETPKRAKRRS